MPALLRDAWDWCTAVPQFSVGLVVGAVAQLVLAETLRLLILGRRE